MAKLSTPALKQMIGQWLSDHKIQKDIRTYYIYDDFTADDLKEFLEQGEELGLKKLGIKKTDTMEEVRDKIAKAFCDPNKWKRVEKRKLKEDWQDKFSGPDNTYSKQPKPEFGWDWAGGCNEKLVAEIYADKKARENCILRMFIPDGYMGDNFRLEVITDPTDSQVVGWDVTVD